MSTKKISTGNRQCSGLEGFTMRMNLKIMKFVVFINFYPSGLTSFPLKYFQYLKENGTSRLILRFRVMSLCCTVPEKAPAMASFTGPRASSGWDCWSFLPTPNPINLKRNIQDRKMAKLENWIQNSKVYFCRFNTSKYGNFDNLGPEKRKVKT